MQVSWTHALRQIVTNCYKFHGREDLLPQFNEEDEQHAANDKAEHKSHSSAIVQQNHSRASSTATVVSIVAANYFFKLKAV